ncbi:MAG TPA: VgrG-related protein [Acidimicrobiales bacterium]|jgi:uncharacterized protein involved in type VI secretion and phage assembly|nr:VgrG-related protein [Acidimicrobiales bacterium]
MLGSLAGALSGSIAARSNAVNWHVKVAGAALPAAKADRLIGGLVRSVIRGASTCDLVFHDHEFDIPTFARIGTPITVEIKDGAALPGMSRGGGKIFDGIVVGIDATREGHQTITRVRCSDKLQLLYHGRRTKAYLKTTPDAVVRTLILESGLMPGTIDSVNVVFDYISQWHESDGDFIERLAAEFGMVFRMKEGKVEFCAPPAASSAPSPASPGSSTPAQLVLGDDVARFDVSYSGEYLVNKVEARGWNSKTKSEIVASKTIGTAPGKNMAVAAMQPIDAANAGLMTTTKTFLTSTVPLASQSHATKLATSVASEIASTFGRVEAVTIGNPSMLAGVPISVGPTTHPMAGKYVVTTAEHQLEAGEYTTRVVCGGLEDRGVGGEASRSRDDVLSGRFPGVLIGIVTNNNDPEKLGRVKVKFPQFDATYESDWLRVVSAGAGAGRGFTMIPEANDEVVVAFEHGDPRSGFVLGGVWNGRDKPTQPAFDAQAIQGGKVEKRGFTSRAGHHIVFQDKAGEELIEVKSGKKALTIKLDDKENTITVAVTNGAKTTFTLGPDGMKVETDKDVMVKATNNITFEAQKDITLKGLNVKVDAQTNFEAKAKANATIEGTGGATLKSSAIAKLEGAQAQVAGQAMAEVKAAMVKIN